MESLKEKGGRFLKTIVLNGREVAQLTETLKQKVQAGAQRIRRYEKRETQCSQNKTFKENTTNFPETLA
jgi:hypothetical protein